MRYGVKLANPYSLVETLEKLRYQLSATESVEAIKLLEKAISKARENGPYCSKLQNALLNGSTVSLRELLSEFGDYFSPPRSEFPFYPHTDAVNCIDSAMHTIKFDVIKPRTLQEHVNFMSCSLIIK